MLNRRTGSGSDLADLPHSTSSCSMARSSRCLLARLEVRGGVYRIGQVATLYMKGRPNGSNLELI